VSGPRKVVVDTDPCLLTFGLDVDDDLALLFLLASPEVEVIGVTTTYGNSLGSLTYRDAKGLLRRAGRSDIPVKRGAGFFARDTRETEASRFLVETVRRQPGEVTLLTLGPLTNLAAAVHAWPELPRHLRDLVMMGGRSRSGLSEFNFRKDPRSAAAALALQVPKVEIPFDLIFPVVITERDLDALATSRVLAPLLPRLHRFARLQDRFRRRRHRFPEQLPGGFHPWDGVAAAWLVAPDLFHDLAEVVHRADAKGRSFLTAPDGSATVRLPGAIDAAGFKRLFLSRLGALAASGR